MPDPLRHARPDRASLAHQARKTAFSGLVPPKYPRPVKKLAKTSTCAAILKGTWGIFAVKRDKYSRGQRSTQAKVAMEILIRPAFCNATLIARSHAAAVAPVVNTSSINRMWCGASPEHSRRLANLPKYFLFCRNAPATFAARPSTLR